MPLLQYVWFNPLKNAMILMLTPLREFRYNYVWPQRLKIYCGQEVEAAIGYTLGEKKCWIYFETIFTHTVSQPVTKKRQMTHSKVERLNLNYLVKST